MGRVCVWGSLSGCQYPLYFARSEHIAWVAGERKKVVDEFGTLPRYRFIQNTFTFFFWPSPKQQECFPRLFVARVMVERLVEPEFRLFHLALRKVVRTDHAVCLALVTREPVAVMVVDDLFRSDNIARKERK